MSEGGPTPVPALPGQPCRTPPHESWSELEKWVWQELGSGRTADINGKLGHTADPRKAEDCGADRRLSPTFLEAILLRDPWRSAISRRGVRIVGALFEEAVDLEDARLPCLLSLESCRFERSVLFSGLQTSKHLSFEGSIFAIGLRLDHAQVGGRVNLVGATVSGTLEMGGAEIGDLFMKSDRQVSQGRADFNDVSLIGAKVGGQVSLVGAKVAGKLDMNRVDIGQDLHLRSDSRVSEHRAEFNDVVLNGTKIGGRVTLVGANVAGKLDMGSAEIGESLFMASDRRVSQHRAEFGETVLSRARIGGHVSLSGAKVTGTLNMSAVDIGQDLLMHSDRMVSEHRSEFSEVVLVSAKVSEKIGLVGAKVTGVLNMNGVVVGQSLFMDSDSRVTDHRAKFKRDVILVSARIGGQLSLIGTTVAGKLDMSSANVGQDLLMRSDSRVSEHRAEFNDVILINARVGGQLSLNGAKITGTLNMYAAHFGRDLLMHSGGRAWEHRAEFNDVSLIGAKVGGQVSLNGAKVRGKLNMEAVDIGQSLFMGGDGGISDNRAEFSGPVSLVFARIGSGLDLRGAALSRLDLSGTKIGGELVLAGSSWAPHWQKSASLVLRNTSTDAIQDTAEDGVWPEHLDLDGFTYRRIGGFGADAEAIVAKRGLWWFINWLAKDEPYTPEPYHQCAKVLREMGYPEMADDVLYAGRERDRREALQSGNNPRATGLALLKWTIGYGYGRRLLWRPLLWAMFLVVSGMLLPDVVQYVGPDLLGDRSAWCAEEVETGGPICLDQEPLGWRLLFSVDMLLPIVELSREHTVVQAGLDGIGYAWFVVQRFLGWVIALFVIAGLTGLTK